MEKIPTQPMINTTVNLCRRADHNLESNSTLSRDRGNENTLNKEGETRYTLEIERYMSIRGDRNLRQGFHLQGSKIENNLTTRVSLLSKECVD